MYALADASGAIATTRIIRRVGPRAKRLRAANKAPPKATSGILSCDLVTDYGGPVASPRCSLTVVASPPFSFPLSMRPYRFLLATCAQGEFCFPTIPTVKTLSVTIVTSLDFIFFMSDIRNADTFDLVFASSSVLSRLASSRDLFICAKYLLFETCSLPDACSVVHLALKCSDIFEHVGLRTLLDDPALLQIAQDATDVLARHPGHGSQVLSADSLVEQNASATRVLADIVREFEQRAGNTAPHRQEALGSQRLIGLSQARGQDGREMLVDLRIVFGAVLKRLPGDVSECRIAQSDGRCGPRLAIDEGELADDLARSHQRDDAFFAPIRRNRDFDQPLLDAIAAIAAVAGHKERLPGLDGALERAGKQLPRHLRRQAGKNQARPL